MKWWIAGVATLAFVAALMVWVLTSSEDEPTEYPTPEAAVVAVCHADPARTPFAVNWGKHPPIDAVGYPLVWVGVDETVPTLALLNPTDSGKFTVRTCDAHVRIPPQ